MLVLLFSLELRWLPPSGYLPLRTDPVGALQTSILPAFTLGVALAAPLTRFLRSGMLDVLALDYVRTARAKGLPERAVVTRHALKNALLSVVTVLGLQLGALLGGSIVIEQVFGWPGLGRLSLAAIQQRDYGVVRRGAVRRHRLRAGQLRGGSHCTSTRGSGTGPRLSGIR
jgi:peptide/nickel transport system permease protein